MDGDRRTPSAEPVEAPGPYKFPKTAEGLLPWSHVDERLTNTRYYWLATTRPDGRPHTTPLWGVWIGGAVYFDGLPITRWGRNVKANPHASVHSAENVVILEGILEDIVTDPETGKEIVNAWNAKYGEFLPKPATDGIFRFRPRTARAWSTATLEDGTRWRWEDRP